MAETERRGDRGRRRRLEKGVRRKVGEMEGRKEEEEEEEEASEWRITMR